jgi:hypothetical protein
LESLKFKDGILTNFTNENAIAKKRRKFTSIFEVVGSLLAMVYAMSIALNIGVEILGFTLLLISSFLFAGWAILDKRWTFLVLQGFYLASAIIGLIRWA